MNTEQEAFEHWYMQEFEVYPRRSESGGYRSQYVAAMYKAFKAGRAALQSQPINEGWKEAAIAWEVCASLHREFCKGRDPFFKVRQADFVKHAEDARTRAIETNALQSQDREDAERLDWLEEQAQTSRTGVSIDYVYDAEDGYVNEKGYRFMRHRFLGPLGKTARAAIDHARRIEGES